MRGRKSNFVACVHCRQMKVACDAPSNFPAGCSRCAKAGKFCSVDPSFKRTKRRQRLQQVEQELREVKVAMSSLKEQPHDNTSNESHTPVLQLPESSNSVPLPQATATLDDLLVPTARSIGSVQLSTSLIKELLTEYYQFYHPVCPILPPLSAFVAHSDESPFLFWTVMLTALRAKPELKGFFVPLVVEVSRMAYDCIQPKNASLHAVQALLLLCYWNLPFEKLPFDPSLSFVNMATQICLRMGLHRPGFAAEFDRVSAVHNTINIPRQIAWIFCFASNVSVNGQLGLPPTVRLDRGLLDVLATKPTWLPDTLYCQMHISHQLLKILTTLGCHESSATGLLPKPDHLVPVFETELRVLEAHLSPYWSRVDYINFCTCKFVLYILAISAIDSDGVDFDAVADDKRSQWIVQAYMCVIASIQAASTIQDQLIKMPTRIYKALAADVSFLVLLKCSKHYYLVDNSALSTAIRQGWELSRKFEIVPNDFITRSCSLIERLSIYSETWRPEDKTEDLITTKARMGFNVARSTALLVHRKIVKNGQENETAADDPTEQANEFNMEMADLEFFLDFDWNESLLSLPS